MSPKIKEICKKHNVRFTSFDTMLDALKAHFAFMKKLADPEYEYVATKPANLFDDGQGALSLGTSCKKMN